MKVSLTLDVDARDRYVIAKYFGTGARATRRQVRAFASGAVRSFVKQHGDALAGRQRSTAKRLERKLGEVVGIYEEGGEAIAEPRERQLNLLDGEAKWTSR